MSDLKVKAENIGPIEAVEFALERPGVTILYGPNGAGKSILGESLDSAMAGSGKVPVKDHASRGLLSAFGATVTFGARTRHTGGLQVLSLSGKVDIASLVDPKIKDPAAADRHRIKQLLLISAPELSDRAFRDSGLFPDFDDIAESAIKDPTDYVDMGDKIKRAYESASRKAADEASRASAEAQACQMFIDEVDLLAESDESLLLERYNAVRELAADLERQERDADKKLERIQSARNRLEELRSGWSGLSVADAQAELTTKTEEHDEAAGRVRTLVAELRQAEQVLLAKESAQRIAEEKLKSARQYASGVAACEQIIATAEGSPLDAMEIAEQKRAAAEAVAEAEKAISLGARVRDAKEKQEVKKAKVEEFIAKDKVACDYRNAALAVEDVLSGLVNFASLQVSQGRLRVVGHPRGEGVLFHDLSQGERYGIVLRLLVGVIGVGGVFVLCQEGWESLDAFVREEIDHLSRQLGVYVLALEATPKQSMGRSLQAKLFEAE